MNNQRLVKKIIYWIGIIFALIQILNVLFFNTTPNHIIRYPIFQFYGLQGIVISILIFFVIMYLTNYKKHKNSIDLIIIWTYCFLNSVYARLHDSMFYTFNFLLFLLAIISLLISIVILDLNSNNK